MKLCDKKGSPSIMAVQRFAVTRACTVCEVHCPSRDVTESFTHLVRVVQDNSFEVLTVTSTVSGSGSSQQCRPGLSIKSV